MHNKTLHILIDHREQASGIPAMFIDSGAELSFENLTTGDYIINDEIVIERKSAEDFVQSLISDRLFTQCSRLVRSVFRPFLLLEGNPYCTQHQIDHRAVKGGLLSVVAAWQIPIIHSENADDSANVMMMLGNQLMRQNHLVHFHTRKPRRLKNHRLKFLQGLPAIGAVTALKLLEHFGSIQEIVNADISKLQSIEGIGKKTAEKIRAFVACESKIQE